ncbi:MAG: phosphoribosylaminoimidazolesuccinocarboxamide synthase [Elusimicrobiota bacterium]|nr:phosphoribosylaminoimidazolesuccinocarboxamide synthase [Elusimicrobiota bacterium]
MNKNFKGKTKIVSPESKDRLKLEFRDTILGQDGLPDSGGNEVIGFREGKGLNAMFLSEYFFRLLQSRGINTHYISSYPSTKSIMVKKTRVFGKGLEFICRRRAYGSFLRRYEDYVRKFQKLNYLVEITIKDDEKKDPLINNDTLVRLGIISKGDLKKSKKLTKKVASIINFDLKEKGLELIDIKVEFGRIGRKLAVIDTINRDNMRVWNPEEKIFPSHKELCEILMPGRKI